MEATVTMGEPVSVVRMTISVPKDLKKEMDEVGDTVNWSAEAAKAFKQKLIDMAANKKAETNEELVKWMRAADEIDSDEGRKEGIEAGRNCVRSRRLRPRDLRKAVSSLASYQEYDDPDNYIALCNNGLNKGSRIGIYVLFHDDSDSLTDAEVNEFWDTLLDRDEAARIDLEESYAAGFLEGLMDEWGKVSSKL